MFPSCNFNHLLNMQHDRQQFLPKYDVIEMRTKRGQSAAGWRWEPPTAAVQRSGKIIWKQLNLP